MSLDRLQREAEDRKIEEVLAFYADPDHYEPDGRMSLFQGDVSRVPGTARTFRPGKRARQALGWESSP